MTDKEKANKYDEIVELLWGWALGGNMLQSTIASGVIRQLDIYSPNGDDPNSA